MNQKLKLPIHSLNEISTEFLTAFATEIVFRRAVGMRQIEGKVFEQILCDIWGSNWKGSNTGLTDALIAGIVAYSVKSKSHTVKGNKAIDSKGKQRRISTIVGRNSPDTHDGSHIEKMKTPADKAAKKVISIWNQRLEEAHEVCADFRQLTILKSNDLCDWLLFEFVPQPLDAVDFNWEWKRSRSKKETINLYGINDKFKLTWQPNGSQFTLNQEIPKKNFQFSLKKDAPVLAKEAILDQIGFQKDWITIK